MENPLSALKTVFIEGRHPATSRREGGANKLGCPVIGTAQALIWFCFVAVGKSTTAKKNGA